jgi:hypothetical protein
VTIKLQKFSALDKTSDGMGIHTIFYKSIGIHLIRFRGIRCSLSIPPLGVGQSHEKCIIVVCGITAAAIENPIGSASGPIFGDANYKNPVACAPGYC